MSTILVIALALAWSMAPSDSQRIRPRDAASYETKQSHEGITVAAEAYTSEEMIKSAFGKDDPRGYGILPVYVVFFNPTKDAVQLSSMEITLERGVGARRERFTTIPAVEVSRRMTFKVPQFDKHAKVPKPISSILEQEFLVRMIPPGDTIGGFFYFDHYAGFLSDNSNLVLTGIRWASSGKELLFFELPITDARKP